MRRQLARLLVLLVACWATPVAARSLRDLLLADPCRQLGPSLGPALGRASCRQFARPLEAFNDTFASSVARSLPLVAASAGFVYRYDPESDTFERETVLPGQLYLETAEPVGRGRWNVGVSYQHVRFDTLDGQDLGSLSDVGTLIRLHVATRAGRFDLPLTISLLDLDLDTHQVTTSVTYGATDDLDVNVTVPVLSSEFETRARGTCAASLRSSARSAWGARAARARRTSASATSSCVRSTASRASPGGRRPPGSSSACPPGARTISRALARPRWRRCSI